MGHILYSAMRVKVIPNRNFCQKKRIKRISRILAKLVSSKTQTIRKIRLICCLFQFFYFFVGKSVEYHKYSGAAVIVKVLMELKLLPSVDFISFKVPCRYLLLYVSTMAWMRCMRLLSVTFADETLDRTSPISVIKAANVASCPFT